MIPGVALRPRDSERGASRRSGRGVKEIEYVRLPSRPRLDVKRGQIGDIPSMLRLGEAAIGVSLASEEAVARIVGAHPDALWSFWRHDRFVGGTALLMLNAKGLAALLADQIDLGDPPARALAQPGEPPAAIYVWAMLGGAMAAEGIAHVFVRLQHYPYERSDIFGLPTTADGARFQRSFGMRPVPGHPRSLHRYVRLANRNKLVG
jgi:hypothetical protein